MLQTAPSDDGAAQLSLVVINPAGRETVPIRSAAHLALELTRFPDWRVLDHGQPLRRMGLMDQLAIIGGSEGRAADPARDFGDRAKTSIADFALGHGIAQITSSISWIAGLLSPADYDAATESLERRAADPLAQSSLNGGPAMLGAGGLVDSDKLMILGTKANVNAYYGLRSECGRWGIQQQWPGLGGPIAQGPFLPLESRQQLHRALVEIAANSLVQGEPVHVNTNYKQRRQLLQLLQE